MGGADAVGVGELHWDIEFRKCLDSYAGLAEGKAALPGVEIRPVDVSPIGELPASLTVYLYSGPVGVSWKGEYTDERAVDYPQLELSGATLNLEGARDPVAIMRAAAKGLDWAGRYGRARGTVETPFGSLGFSVVNGQGPENYVFIGLPAGLAEPERLAPFFGAVGEEYEKAGKICFSTP
ncbi:MAG: hypothetical protein V1820_05045 [archaeon]